jgi:hypothetical protein
MFHGRTAHAAHGAHGDTGNATNPIVRSGVLDSHLDNNYTGVNNMGEPQ